MPSLRLDAQGDPSLCLRNRPHKNCARKGICVSIPLRLGTSAHLSVRRSGASSASGTKKRIKPNAKFVRVRESYEQAGSLRIIAGLVPFEAPGAR